MNSDLARLSFTTIDLYHELKSKLLVKRIPGTRTHPQFALFHNGMFFSNVTNRWEKNSKLTHFIMPGEVGMIISSFVDDDSHYDGSDQSFVVLFGTKVVGISFTNMRVFYLKQQLVNY